MTNLNKNQYARLLLESAQLAMQLSDRRHEGHFYRWSHTVHLQNCAQQRHWRRVIKYNKLFGESLYVPGWYIAEVERKNEQQS